MARWLSTAVAMLLSFCANALAGQPANTLSAGLAVAARVPLTIAVNGVDGELQIVKDARITAKVAEDAWGTGGFVSKPEETDPDFKSSPPHNALIRVVNREGAVLDSKELERPLARLGSVRLYGDGRVTYLLTVDYSAGMGSYNGPITSLVEVYAGHLHWVEAMDKATPKSDRISLMSSLKTVWKIVDVAETGRKEILRAACRPDTTHGGNTEFTTTYSRFYFDGKRWVRLDRSVKGINEFDEGFPSRRLFP